MHWADGGARLYGQVFDRPATGPRRPAAAIRAVGFAHSQSAQKERPLSVTDSELPASWTTEEIAESAESAQNAVSPARLSIADVLTLGNAVCGFASVYFITTNVLVPYLSDGPGQEWERYARPVPPRSCSC